MAEYTENYNLKKPAQEDFYNVEDFNNNADVIDKEMKAVSDKAAAALPASSYTAADILNKLKTVDGVNSGLDADLFKGKSVIPVENGGTGENTLSNFVNYKGRLEVKSLSQIRETGLYLIYGVAYDDCPTNSGNFAIMTVYQAANYVYQTVYGAFTNNNSVAINYRWINSTGFTTGWCENVNTINLPALIQSALQSGGVSVVKSIQRGVITISAKNTKTVATISAVNTSKAFVIYTGFNTTDDISETIHDKPYLELTNSTTVTAIRRFVNTDQRCSTIVPYQVIEYY